MFVRRKPRVRLEPIQSGGGQERGLRSGTVPTPLVVGFGEACKIAKYEMAVSKIFLVLFCLRMDQTLVFSQLTFYHFPCKYITI